MSKHETGTVTKQTTGALQFMVAFALRGGGGGGGQLLREYISLCCALRGKRSVPAIIKLARLLPTPQNTIHRFCAKHKTTLLCPSTRNATVSKQGTDCCVKARDICWVKSTDTLL